MNKIFSFDRFWKYFKYDLVNAKSNFGLSALILGFLPLMAFIIGNLLSIIFTGEWAGWSFGTGIGIMAMCASFAISAIIAGVKLYGHLTDRKAGSNWILIPASTFEKFLSMVLIVFLVVPVCLAAMLLASDFILRLFPGYSPVTGMISNSMVTLADSGIKVNLIAMLWLMWGQYSLAFLLGAVLFKKAKVAKTILWGFIISSVIGIILVRLIGISNLPEIFVRDASEISVSSVQSKVNWFLSICWTGWIALLCGGIFWRLRTIKH